VAETSGLRAELNNAAKITKDASSKMDKAIADFSTNSSKNVGFFETTMATMTGFLAAEAVQAVLGFAKDGLQFLSNELMKGAESAIAEEAALKRLANSLALSGQYSKEAMTELTAFTGRMESMTGIADDVVAANLAMLSSFTKLDSEGLQRAQQAAIDFSVATGKDLETATQMVAKAINGSTDSFKKMGINIVESTDKAQALKNVLGVLEGQFAGAGAGAAQTFGGAMTNLTNSWGNFTESIATAITKNPVVIAMMNTLTEAFSSLTETADGSAVMLREGVAKAFIYTAQAIGIMAQVADVVFRGITLAIQAVVAGLNAIAGTIAWVADGLGLIDDNNPFERLKDTSEAMGKTLTEQGALGKIGNMFQDMGIAGEAAFSSIKNSSDAVGASIANQVPKVQELDAAYGALLTSFATGLADRGAALDNEFAYENELRAVQLETELAQLTEHNANKWEVMALDMMTRSELQAAQHEKEWSDLEAARANQLITEQQYANATAALLQKQFLDKKKLESEKTKNEQAEQAARTAGYMTFLDGIASLSSSSNKTIAGIAKAAAITKTTIDAYVAIQNALANVPFPANIAAAAGIGAMAFANVAKVAGIGLNKGGTIAGGGANMDSVPASLTKGETVITRDMTDKLGEYLDNRGSGGGGGGAGGAISIEITLKDQLAEFIEAKIIERRNTNVSLLVGS
jgi:hypothetical protein